MKEESKTAATRIICGQNNCRAFIAEVSVNYISENTSVQVFCPKCKRVTNGRIVKKENKK